jgi:hypothetical protein
VRRLSRAVQRELARVRNARHFSRAPRLPSRWRTTVWWFFVCLLSVAGVVALAYLVGKDPPGKGGEPWYALRQTVRGPGVAVPLAFALLAVLAYSCRRLRLESLAWLPGRIQVADFTTTNVSTASAAQLTDAFRSRMAGMRLASSPPSPAAQPEADFLDVLNSAGASPGNVLGTLLGLLQAAVPKFAYEVRGVVVADDATPRRYTVSLQIKRLPNEACPQVEVTETDLDRAILRAADHATAAILPRTRLCRGPWAAWRRYTLPGALLNAYEEACEHDAARRYDQAMQLYYRALREDPMNLMLRLQLGQLQEKLRQFLPALVTYTAMEYIASSPSGAPAPGLYPRRAERERTRALLLARYRRAVLLGEASFVKTWRRSDAARGQLEPWLRERLPTTILLMMNACDMSDGWPGERNVHNALTLCADEEIRALRRDMPRIGSAGGRRPLTRRALDLTSLCLRERRKVAVLSDAGLDRPTPVHELEAAVRRIERSRLLRRRVLRRWEEQYNAACLFAIALFGSDASESDKKRYADHAVKRLELAAAGADSSFIAHRHDWLTAEDPDLTNLRGRTSFKAFEARYFPTDRPVSRLPGPVHELVELRCTRDLLTTAACAWEHVWRERASIARSHPTSSGDQWWRVEHNAWRHVAEVAGGRNSLARLKLVETAHEWRASYRTRPIESRFTRYDEEPLPDPDAELDKAAGVAIEKLENDLSELSKLLDRSATSGFIASIVALEVFDAHPELLSSAMWEKFCSRQAVVWRRLHEWLAPGLSSNAQGSCASFEEELQRATSLWEWVELNAGVRRYMREALLAHRVPWRARSRTRI